MHRKQSKFIVRSFIFMLIGTAGIAACTAEFEDVDFSAEQQQRQLPGDVAPTPQDLVNGGEYSWYQGWGEIPMGTTNGRVCFLTHIQGRFEGGGESVYVRAGWDGSWWLGGTSLQAGVGARARCVNSSYSTEYSWAQGQLPAYMGGSWGQSCFLTRVSGKFKGGGEYVYAYDSGNGWWLGGASLQQGVSASARCIPYSSSEYSWSQGWAPVIMGNTATQTCFLNRMTGHFAGGGESITVFASGPNWYLGGTSYQQGVGASARCI